jgi:uncharacterized alpha/beta hydrolase family protein
MRVLAAIDVRGASAEHVTASCVRGSKAIDSILDGLKGRLDLENIALLGHSYGGATVAGVWLEGTSQYNCLSIIQPLLSLLN